MQRGLEGECVKRKLIRLLKNAAQLSPSPIHLNQQLYRADDSVSTAAASLLKMTACVHVCESHTVYKCTRDLRIKPLHVRADILITLQKLYNTLHLWLVISIHPHLRKLNEEKFNKSDLSLLPGDEFFLLKIHSLSDPQDRGHLIHNMQ